MDYQVGDLIVYGGSNCICSVSNITEMGFPGTDKIRLYYVLKPLYQNCVIYNPVDNKDVLMRPVITKDEAEKLIDMIPGMNTEPYQGSELRQITEHYESILQTHDCEKLIELTMSIYAKKQFLLDRKRNFGALEETFMKRAEEMLFGELSVALDIPKNQVKAYIAERVDGKQNS
jgi:CarD family transcriptional regulator